MTRINALLRLFSKNKLPVINDKLRAEWYDRLCDVAKCATCPPIVWVTRNGIPEQVQYCVAWDSGYNSALDEPLNSRRAQDQQNYYIWMKGFCDHIDLTVHESLRKFGRRGCMCCIGRILYNYLRFEFIRPYLFQTEDYETLRTANNFPDNLKEAPDIELRRIASGMMNDLTYYVVSGLRHHCRWAYYEHLAVLLNHGCDFPSYLRGGAFEAYYFHTMDVEYNADMLRERYCNAYPEKNFERAMKRLSVEQGFKIVRAMHSRVNHDIRVYP